jgi:anti-sigma factor RsiW
MASWRTHPEESDLLRYCDGELRARAAGRMARHLEACWDCRTRLDDLKAAIAEYVRYRRDVLEPALPRPPEPWKNLRAEFARLQQAQDSGGAWRRFFERRAVWLLAGALTAGTGILFYTAREMGQAGRAIAPRAAAIPAPPAAPGVMPKPAAAEPRPSVSGPEDELRVIAALHHIGADLGDPIEVVRTRDRVVVTCIGLGPERMREVRAALAGLPRVAVELSPKPNVSAAGSPLEVVGAPHTAMRTDLARQFDSPADYDRFVDGLLKSSEAIMARAHALRRLATRFPAIVELPMSADAKALLADMRGQHQTALAREVSALQRSVQPYLTAAGAPAPPAAVANPAGEDWQTRTMRVFAEAAEVDRMLGAVFAGSQGGATGEASPAALAAALAKLEADVE